MDSAPEDPHDFPQIPAWYGVFCMLVAAVTFVAVPEVAIPSGLFVPHPLLVVEMVVLVFGAVIVANLSGGVADAE